jgi:hypothetical protein
VRPMSRLGSRNLAVLVLCAALALGATACGGGDDEKAAATTTAPGGQGFSPYEVQMQQLGQTLGRALLELGSANKTAPAATVVKDLRQAQKELRSAAVKLTALTPPEKIQAQHKRLIKGVRDYANDIDDVIAKYKRGNRQAVFSVTDLPGVKEMQRASQAISKAGYVIVLG